MARRMPVATMDARRALEEFHDHLAPTLDVYEQAVYLYILRHSRLLGKPGVAVEIKTARHKIARSPGKRGGPLTAQTCLDKLRSLDAKGCIKLAGDRRGTPDVRVLLPSEVPGLIDADDRGAASDLDGVDFFNVAENRRLILQREGGRCFYCRKKLNDSNTAVAHVAPRPSGDDGYRNVVAACRRCNNRKGESSADNLLRVLYRESCITADVLADRLAALQDLRAGRLRPGRQP